MEGLFFELLELPPCCFGSVSVPTTFAACPGAFLSSSYAMIFLPTLPAAGKNSNSALFTLSIVLTILGACKLDFCSANTFTDAT